MRYFRLPPRFTEGSRSSRMLRNVYLKLQTFRDNLSFQKSDYQITLRNIPEERRHQGRITAVTEQMHWATLPAYKGNKNYCDFLSMK
jgi:hypothetical protein